MVQGMLLWTREPQSGGRMIPSHVGIRSAGQCSSWDQVSFPPLPCSTQTLPAFGAEDLGHGAGAAFLPAHPNRRRTFLSSSQLNHCWAGPWVGTQHSAEPCPSSSFQQSWIRTGSEQMKRSYCHYRTGAAVFGAFAPHPRAPKPPAQLSQPLKIPSLESEAEDGGGKDPGRTEGHSGGGGRCQTREELGQRKVMSPPCTHQTRARRGGWPWRAAPGAAVLAASSEEGGWAGTEGHWVLCQGQRRRQGPPLWWGCCGREEPVLPSTSP